MFLIRDISWQYVGILAALYFFTLGVYRLYFHPLAKFPGPVLAALTRGYEAYYDVIRDGQYTFKIAELHQKYGPIIRISPYELHVIDPSYYEKLYRQEGRWNKYSWPYDAFSVKYSTICTAEHDLHRRRRAPLNSFFSKASVIGKQNLIQNLVNKLCARVDAYSDYETTAFRLGHAISAFTRDVATQFILGKTYNHLDATDFNAAISTMLQSSGSMWRITKHVPWFGPLMLSLPITIAEKIGNDGVREALTFLSDITQITKEMMSTSRNSTSNLNPESNIVEEILSSNLPAVEKRYERINDDVGTVTGAAYETTAQALRLIIYHIFSNPTILQCLRIELETANKTNPTDVDLVMLEQLPYLRAVLMEGLRLSPGIATRTARIAPDRDLVYDKWVIPAGTPVGMTTLLMHMDSTIYPNPKEFNPERWMDAEERRKVEKTYAPFSRGTRICLGMHLAWAELYMVTAALVQRFDFKFIGVGPRHFECTSDQFIIGTEDQHGLQVLVTRRTASET